MKWLATVAFWFLGIIWGTNFIFMKWGTELITPMQLAFVRVISGLAPIFIYALLKGNIKLSHYKYSHHFLCMALLSTVVYYYSIAMGASLLPSGIAGAVSGAMPIFAFIASMLILNEEKLSKRKLLGIMLGFVGVLLLSKPFQSGAESASLAGVFYMVLGSLCGGIAFAYTKKYISPLGVAPAALVSYQLLIGAVLLSFVMDFSGMENLASNTQSLWGALIGLGLLGTGLAFITYYFIIDKLGAITASSATYIPPIVALFVGALFANEEIYVMDYIATGLILLGVLILNFDKYMRAWKQ